MSDLREVLRHQQRSRLRVTRTRRTTSRHQPTLSDSSRQSITSNSGTNHPTSPTKLSANFRLSLPQTQPMCIRTADHPRLQKRQALSGETLHESRLWTALLVHFWYRDWSFRLWHRQHQLGISRLEDSERGEKDLRRNLHVLFRVLDPVSVRRIAVWRV